METRLRGPFGVVLVVTLLATVGGGCRRREEAPPVQWEGQEKPAALPEKFPKDVPVYPNATIDAAVTGRGGIVIWKTSDPLPKVQRYYTEQLNAKGWHVTTYPGVSAPWLGDGGVTVIGTGWGRRISFAIGEKEASTVITAVWHGKSS